MSSGNENDNGQVAGKEDGGSGGDSGPVASSSEGGSGTGGGFMDRFHIRDYASTAERKADELNSQFGSLCNKLTGEKKSSDSSAEEKKPDGEESLVDQITDFGTKGYGLMGALGKKFEKK